LNAVGYAVSLAVCGAAAARATRTLDERKVPILGVAAAFVFAAQMLNFPVVSGTSGHFLGAALMSVLLGPVNACLVMALVLTIQCLLFADGGLTALGINIFNMGIVAGLGSYAIFAVLSAILPRGRKAFLASAAVASWCSVVLAAAFCAMELALSGTSPWVVVLPAMVGVHALIGVGEALITATTLSVVLASRPDIVTAWAAPQIRAFAEGGRA
jgi:cobalt/nickel transport system permease protein